MEAERAEWVNGKKSVWGMWRYNWSADNFTVFLEQRDRTTGESKTFTVYGDTPEWGNWKLVRKSYTQPCKYAD